jgi:hypothetical protein
MSGDEAIRLCQAYLARAPDGQLAGFWDRDLFHLDELMRSLGGLADELLGLLWESLNFGVAPQWDTPMGARLGLRVRLERARRDLLARRFGVRPQPGSTAARLGRKRGRR